MMVVGMVVMVVMVDEESKGPGRSVRVDALWLALALRGGVAMCVCALCCL